MVDDLEAALLIDGEVRGRTCRPTLDDIDPATGEVLARVVDGTPDDVDAQCLQHDKHSPSGEILRPETAARH